MERESYVVVVTYGTVRADQVYGRARNIRDAKSLLRAAVGRNYGDARIERESDFQAAQADYGSLQADSRWPP
jgi:hypothetical protein